MVTGRTRFLAIAVGLAWVITMAMPGPALSHAPTPRHVRVEVRVSPWATVRFTEPTHNKIERTDTRIVDARPGDDLVDTTLFGIWVGVPHRLSPLSLGAILAPDRAWVRMTRKGCCGVYSLDGYSDSVLVSTSWRTFDTRTMDAGTIIRLRLVADSSSLLRPGDAPLLLRSWSRQPSDMERLLRSTEVVGVFRVLRVTRASDPSPQDAQPHFRLAFRAEDVWFGSAIHSGDSLTAEVNLGMGTDTTWTPWRTGTPMRVGHGVVLFLSRHIFGFNDRWSFSPFGGYGLFDEGEHLVFSYPIRGEPVDRFRHRVEWEAWLARHPFEGRVFGHVFADSTDRPLAGARIGLGGQEPATASVDSTGWFEIVGIPIGQRLLRVTGTCPPASGVVDVTDEYADTLEVRVPCAR